MSTPPQPIKDTEPKILENRLASILGNATYDELFSGDKDKIKKVIALINQQVFNALEEAKSKSQLALVPDGESDTGRRQTEAVPVSVLTELQARYRDE